MEPVAYVELVRRMAASGDHQSWREFIDRAGRRLVARVRRSLRRVGSPVGEELVEELLQEVYCRLLERGRRLLRSFRGVTEGEVMTYLGKVVDSVVIDHLRAAGAAKRGQDRQVAANALGGCFELLADPGRSPEEALLARERRSLFLSRCRQVVGGRAARRQLRIVELALLEGWSSREIAAAAGTGLVASSVDSLVYRVRRRLAEEGLRLPRR